MQDQSRKEEERGRKNKQFIHKYYPIRIKTYSHSKYKAKLFHSLYFLVQIRNFLTNSSRLLLGSERIPNTSSNLIEGLQQISKELVIRNSQRKSIPDIEQDVKADHKIRQVESQSPKSNNRPNRKQQKREHRGKHIFDLRKRRNDIFEKCQNRSNGDVIGKRQKRAKQAVEISQVCDAMLSSS